MKTKRSTRCILAAVLALLCVLSFGAKKEPLVDFSLPKNIKALAIVTATIETEAGKRPDIPFLLLGAAQSKKGNAAINIKQSVETVDGKEIWHGSAVAVKINDKDFNNLYKELASMTPKSDDLVYGVGSAKFSTFSMSLTTALTRARSDIARAYSESVVIEGGTVTSSNVNIKASIVEQIAQSPDGTLWIMMSAKKEDIAFVK